MPSGFAYTRIAGSPTRIFSRTEEMTGSASSRISPRSDRNLPKTLPEYPICSTVPSRTRNEPLENNTCLQAFALVRIRQTIPADKKKERISTISDRVMQEDSAKEQDQCQNPKKPSKYRCPVILPAKVLSQISPDLFRFFPGRSAEPVQSVDIFSHILTSGQLACTTGTTLYSSRMVSSWMWRFISSNIWKPRIRYSTFGSFCP